MVPNHTTSSNNIEYVTAFKINPKLYTYTQIFGVFDYNRTPLAPIGTRTVVHLRTTQKGRTTFGDHGDIGWTIGPALDHYRHWDFYIPETRGSAHRASTALLEELTEALKNPEAAKPFLNTGNKLNAAIDALTEILSNRSTTPSSSGASPPRVSERTVQPPRVNNNRAAYPGVNNDPKQAIRPKINPQVARAQLQYLTGFRLWCR
jgi:hypothetical protein